MEPRVSLITLGVADLARARRFYEGLGFTPAAATTDEVAFYDLNGLVLALWPRAQLAKDAQIQNAAPGFGGIALAHNVRVKQQVDEVLETARQLGGEVLKPAQETFWGGYSGYFADLDGHLWEVAFNPFWTIGDDGRVSMGP